MQLNHKLKMERLNRRLSRESLANSLNELLKKDYYTERKIGIIENNEESLKFEVVDEMCFFFNLTIRDLTDKKWSEYNQDFTDYIISILVVFILISLIMKYSLNKINKQNTIETIRNENI